MVRTHYQKSLILSIPESLLIHSKEGTLYRQNRGLKTVQFLCLAIDNAFNPKGNLIYGDQGLKCLVWYTFGYRVC